MTRQSETPQIDRFDETIARLWARIRERGLDQAIVTVERSGHPLQVSVSATGTVRLHLLSVADASARGYLDDEEQVPTPLLAAWQREVHSLVVEEEAPR